MKTKERIGAGNKFLLALMFLALLSGIAFAACPTGMVSYWKGEGNTDDSVGTSNVIALNPFSGYQPTYEAGKVGQAMKFRDLVGLQVAYNPRFNSNQNTVEAWIKPEAAPWNPGHCYGVIFHSAFEYFLTAGYNGRGALEFDALDMSRGNFFGPEFPCTPGQWYYVVGTKEGNTFKLYVNGTYINTYTAAGTNYPPTDQRAWIGTYHYYDNQNYFGLIDELAVYDKILTQDEITAHYNNGNGIDYCSAAAPPEPPTCGQGDTAGMVSYWKGEGNADDVMNANNGQLMNGATATAIGKVGQAFSLDGDSQYIKATEGILNGASAITVEAWANADADQSPNFVDIVTDNSFKMDASYFGKSTFYMNTNTNSWPGCTTAGNTIGQGWKHFVMTYDGTTMKGYIDGEQVCSVAASGTIAAGTVGGMNIGANHGNPIPASGQYFKGRIDEVAVYTRALTQTEIQAHFARTSDGLNHYCERAGAPPEPEICDNSIDDDQDSLTDCDDTEDCASDPACQSGACPDGMISYWKGEGNADDEMGANNGILMGNAVANAVGKVGNAFYLDETSGTYVMVPDSPDFDLTTLTVEGWIKMDPATGHPGSFGGTTFIDYSGDYAGGWASNLQQDDNGPITVWWNAGGAWSGAFSGYYLSKDQWYHIAIIYDTNKAMLYVNGVNVWNVTGGNIGYPNSDRMAFGASKCCGSTTTPNTGFLKGWMDEIAIYDRVLTQSEITAHYNNGNGIDYCSAAAPEPTCTDVIQNQDETDVDCGGICPECAVGQMCAVNSDCQTNTCQGGICIEPPELVYNNVGGTVEDQGITVTVPPGALPTEELLVTIVPSTHSFAPVAGTTVIGQPLDIGPQCSEIADQSACESTNGCQWTGSCTFIPFVSPVTISMPGDCSGTKKIYQQKIAKYIGTSWVPVVTCTPINRGGGFFSCTATDGRLATWNQTSCMMSVQTLTFSSYAVIEGQCGDGIIASSEECDGSDFNGQTCITYGYDAGELGCSYDCYIDYTACYDYPSESAFTIGSATVDPGNSVDIPISLFNGDSIAAMQFIITYPALLQYQGIDSTSRTDSGTVSVNTDVSGVMRFAALYGITSGTRLDAGTGEIYILHFTVSEDAAAGDYPISLTAMKIGDISANELPYAVLDGTLTVTTGPPDLESPSSSASFSGSEQNGWFSSDVNAEIEATDNVAVQSIYYCISTPSSPIDCSPSQYTQVDSTYAAFDVSTIGNDGISTLYYYAVDAAGNAELVKTAALQIDTAAPTTTDNIPPWWINYNLEITIDASDAESGVDMTYLCIASTPSCTPSIEPPQYSLADGVYFIRYYSVDDAGNVEEIKTKAISIDRTMPFTSAVVTGTFNEQGWTNASVGISLDGSDETSGLYATYYCLVWEGTECVYSKSGVPGQGQTSITSEGRYIFSYYSKDNGGRISPYSEGYEYSSYDAPNTGNMEEAKEIAVNIDSSAPNTTMSSSCSQNSCSVSLTAIDPALASGQAGSGISNIMYVAEGGEWQEYTGQFTLTTEGRNYVWFYAIDNAGNQEEVQSGVVMIDNTSPILTTTKVGTEGKNGWYTSPVTVIVNAAEPTSDISEICSDVDGSNENCAKETCGAE